MSSADVFLSSPAGPVRFESYAMSSSPGLPSLDEIFSNAPKKPPLRTRSNAAPIPDNVPTTFTSAASVLRDAPEIDIETEKITDSPPRKSNPSRARRNKAPTQEPTSVPAETPILIESSPGEKPWQKFKSKKSTSQDKQPTLKGRIAKPATKAKHKEKAETVSRHFATQEGVAKRAGDQSENGSTIRKLEEQTTSGPSCSEPALKRRSDWTPPPVDTPIVIGSESDNRELTSPLDSRTRPKDVFQTLQDQYGRIDSRTATASNQQQQADILKKRKLIELVSTSNEVEQHSTETSPSKAVATKKKTRTITELAMAPYMLPTEPELDLAGPATKDSLLNYFDEDGAVKALVEHQTAVMSQKKGKAKEPKASANPKRKKKAGTVDNPILLSPNSALKQSSNQDFVFGTSSQLVVEESPSTLRDLQLAIQASNQIHSDPFAETDSQGLWHAGARDSDGELMKVDDVDSEDLPPLPRLRVQSQPSREEFVDISDILRSSGVDESATQAPQQGLHLFESQTAAVPSAQPPQIECTESQPPAATGDPRPTFELFTDVQLSKKIASYGFKPVKKRQAMIALLDQCWSSKSPGMSDLQSNSMSTSSVMAAPKKGRKSTSAEPSAPPKRRGRPRKDSAADAPSTAKAPASKAPASKAPKAPAPKASAPKVASPKRPRSRRTKAASKPVEIADSDLDESISSASSRASSPDPDRIFSSPPAVDLSISEEADMSLAMSPTDQQADLFRHITKAVTSAPRSTDPSRPSWHEKMLLYDPIVLEDLAAWLNAGALGRTGHDGEVSPFDVKKWCESKSVICLWRVNLRGKERKRF
ncbi:hypothetical protein F4804DRAFT_309458 [Jackrogersella minutella]|nr:hypothetical protein F4804DRAFT_309458 [Jackrogersella minutella]